jgi:hypothetical protein
MYDVACGFVPQQAPRPVLIWDTNSLRWNTIFKILERHTPRNVGLCGVLGGPPDAQAGDYLDDGLSQEAASQPFARSGPVTRTGRPPSADS